MSRPFLSLVLCVSACLASVHAVPVSLPLRVFNDTSSDPVVGLGNGHLLRQGSVGPVLTTQAWLGNGLGSPQTFSPGPWVRDTSGAGVVFWGTPDTLVKNGVLSIFSPVDFSLQETLPAPHGPGLNYRLSDKWIVYSDTSDGTAGTGGLNGLAAGTYLVVVDRSTRQTRYLGINPPGVPSPTIKNLTLAGDRAAFIVSAYQQPDTLELFDLNTVALIASTTQIAGTDLIAGLAGDTVVLDTTPQNANGRLTFVPMAEPEQRVNVAAPPVGLSPEVFAYNPTHINKVISTGGGIWVLYYNFRGNYSQTWELRHYSIGGDGGPLADFTGVWPEIVEVDNSWINLVADGDTAVLTSHNTRFAVFDRANDLPVLTVPDVEARESDGGVTIRATLDRVAVKPVTFRLTGGAGSAVAGVDYEPLDRLVTIPAGSRSAEVRVNFIADTEVEPNESFLVEVSDVSEAIPAADVLSVIIRASGLPLVQGWTPAGLPNGMVFGQVDVIGRNGVIASTKNYGASLSFTRDGKFLAVLEGTQYQQLDAIELDNGNWRSAPQQWGGNLIQVRDWNPATGALVTNVQVSQVPSGKPFIALRNGFVAWWAGGSTITLLDPVAGTSTSFDLPPSEHGAAPQSVLFGDGDGCLAVAVNYPVWQNSREVRVYARVYDDPVLRGGTRVSPAGAWYTEAAEFNVTGHVAEILTDQRRAVDLLTGEVLWEKPRTNLTKMLGAGSGMFFMSTDEGSANGSNYGFVAIDAITGVTVDGFQTYSMPTGVTSVTFRDGIITVNNGGAATAFATSPGQQPALEARLSSALPGYGAVLTVGWKEPAPSGATIRWSVDTAVPSVANQFPLLSGTLAIPASGSVETLVPMSFALSDAVATAPLTVMVSPVPGAPTGAMKASAPLLDGFGVAADVENVTPAAVIASGNYYNYGLIAGGGSCFAIPRAGRDPVTKEPRPEVDLFSADGNLLRTFVPTRTDDYPSFGECIVIQGERILIGASQSATGKPERGGSVSIFNLQTGALVTRIANTLNVPGFGEKIASNAAYFVIGAPGYDPDTSRAAPRERGGFAVYRWSDLKRQYQHVSAGEKLGSSVLIEGDRVLVGAPYASVKLGRLKAAFVGGVYSYGLKDKRFKLFLVPQVSKRYGLFGQRMIHAGGSVWIPGPYADGQGTISTVQFAYDSPDFKTVKALVPDKRGYAPTLTGDLTPTTSLARSLFVHPFDVAGNAAYPGVRLVPERGFVHVDHYFAGGWLYWTESRGVLRTPVSKLGLFQTWARLNLGDAAGDPAADVNRNGQSDFEDYLDAVIPPGASYAGITASDDGTSYTLTEGGAIPPDTVATLEVSANGSEWVVSATREGSAPWKTLEGTNWVDGRSPVVHLPEGGSVPQVRVTLQAHPAMLIQQ